MTGVESQHLIESLSDPLLFCDEDLLVTYMNPAAQALFGGEPEWLEENPADTWIQGPDGLLFPPQGETRELDVAVEAPNATSHRLRACVGPLPVRGGLGYFIHIRGPSAPAERLVGMQVVAGAIAQQLSAHLRTVITRASEGLMSGLSEDNAERLRQILAAGEASAQLQRQLSALDTRGAARRVHTSLGSLLNDCAPDLRRALAPTRLRLTVEEGEGPLLADLEALRLALTILATSTTQISPAPAAVEVGLKTRSGGRLRLSWTLEGTPLSPALREQVLEPRDVHPFGLSVVHAILQAHDGRLVLDSELAGATLHLDLPGLEGQRERRRAAQGGNETVLLVEDDPSIREWVEQSLRMMGYAVTSVDNGLSASVILRERHAELDLLLTDAVLPGRSGLELIAEARRLKPAPRVLLMSGYSADFLGSQLKGDVPLLPKPFGPTTLYEHVRALLDG